MGIPKVLYDWSSSWSRVTELSKGFYDISTKLVLSTRVKEYLEVRLLFATL